MRADSPLYASRRRSGRRSLSIPAALALAAGAAALLAILVGLAFAGSQSELAPGTRVAGVDVGGLTKREAVAKLDSLFEQRSPHPVAFMAATSSYRFAANQLAVQPDWNAAVAAAGRAGDGFGPVRGFRRLRARVFGAEVLPRLVVSNAALEYVLDKISADVDRNRGARGSCATVSASRSCPTSQAAGSTATPQPTRSFAHSDSSNDRPGRLRSRSR